MFWIKKIDFQKVLSDVHASKYKQFPMEGVSLLESGKIG